MSPAIWASGSPEICIAIFPAMLFLPTREPATSQGNVSVCLSVCWTIARLASELSLAISLGMRRRGSRQETPGNESPAVSAPSEGGGARLSKQDFRTGQALEPHRGWAAGGLAMELLRLALLLGCLGGSLAAEESCEGRCDKGFESQKKCQCDELCVYYQSCCSDYATTCKAKVTRGDVFVQPEDDYLDFATDTLLPVPNSTTPEPQGVPDYTWTEEGSLLWPFAPTREPGPGAQSEAPTFQPTEEGKQEEEDQEGLCSEKPFDAFTSLKNGSILAFRGRYLYELDEKSVKPGYPKLIRDVWGIEGPIDAAFTRVNCEGKTYLFQGSRYWRFDEGVLEPDFPRNISEGFEGIPNDLDAALALPAQNYFTSERAYFFKGGLYWSFDFAHQPSRADCERSSPSAVFGHYAALQEDSWEEIFQLLFGGSRPSGASRARPIRRDWRGLPGRLDAALLGRIYLSQSPPKRRAGRKSSRRYRKKYRRRQRWGLWESLDWPSSESSDADWLLGRSSPCQPFQSAYFFAEDKYYRVNLNTRRVDWVHPRYPRPIATYWLGCPPVGPA